MKTSHLSNLSLWKALKSQPITWNITFAVKTHGLVLHKGYRTSIRADRTSILKEIALFGLKLTNGVICVKAKRDCNNLTINNLAPSMMPHKLVNMNSCDFIDNMLEKYRSQLATSWPIKKIDCIEKNQQTILNYYQRKPHSHTIIDNQIHITFFNEGWKALDANHLSALRLSCGDLTSAFVNTTSVELNFSILK